MRYSGALTFTLLLIRGGAIHAQDRASYTFVSCLKIQPGKGAEFEKLNQEYYRVWQQKRADQGQVLHWLLLRAV